MSILHYGFRGMRSHPQELSVNIEISADVKHRILNAISRSNIEEGGKLLGKISQSGGSLSIEVATYIDSGPGVDNSATHLHPDGEYQESMFRVLEQFDPEIDHIGSWHSHHCNGLDHLSDGDISGYKRSVNNRRYGPDYFFVILVYGLRAGSLQTKFYLFSRGQRDYQEIPQSNVSVAHRTYPYEELLRTGENLSIRRRRDTGFRSTAARLNRHFFKDDVPDDPLQEIRAEDSQWLKENFPSVIALRSKTGQIRWRWQIAIEDDFLFVSYVYPLSTGEDEAGLATLEIKYGTKPIISESIPLTPRRHKIIEKIVDAAKSQVTQPAETNYRKIPFEG